MKKAAAFAAQILFIAVCAAGVFSFVRAAQSDQRASSCSALCEMHPAYAGRSLRAPDFELPELSGQLVRLSSMLDKPVVLNFWQKDCQECMIEMPELAAFTRQAKGVHVITVSVDEDPQDIVDALKVSLQGQAAPFPVLLDPEMAVVKGLYGTTLFPETWLIDTAGVIRVRIDGRRTWSADSIVDGVLEMMSRPGGCPVDMLRGQPVGAFAGLCGDSGPICQPTRQDNVCLSCLKQSCCGELRACGSEDTCTCIAQGREECGEPGLVWEAFSRCATGRCGEACRGMIGGL
ncbi:MAG: TlpA family protein disulfide reductase [Myxococcales bacterium]|nr:TlpA family protein disulfide reductase [Myxococcales bacterium]